MNKFFEKFKMGAKTLVKNRLFHLWWIITVTFLIAEWVFGDDKVRIAAESGRIAIYAVLAAMMFVAAAGSFWSGAKRPAEQLAVAIFGIAMAILLHAIWVPFTKYGPLPDSFDPQPVTTALIVAIALAGLGYLIPVTFSGRMPLPVVGSWAGVFAAGLIAGALMGVALATGVALF